MTPPLAPSAEDLALDAEMPRTETADNVIAPSESMNALAALLLEWRVDCERHLRGLTSMQRWLERVRSGSAAAGERELLLQEVGRVLRETPRNHHDWMREAEIHLNRLIR